MLDERRTAYLEGRKDERTDIIAALKDRRQALAADKNDDQIYWQWSVVDDIVSDLEASE